MAIIAERPRVRAALAVRPGKARRTPGSTPSTASKDDGSPKSRNRSHASCADKPEYADAGVDGAGGVKRTNSRRSFECR